MQEFAQLSEKAARAAGKVLLDWQGRITPKEKGVRDLVTEADFASQTVIRDLLLGAYPSHEFLGEEDLPGVTNSRSAGEYRWVVDPLDGTQNYVHRLQTFAVSIALQHRGEVILGTVYDPVSNECFTAVKGQGAFLNGSKIGTKDCQVANDAMVAVSFSPHVDRDSVEFRRFVETTLACQSIRRLGSAALNLAYLAAGRLDAYFATSVKIWDIAAGVLLVSEAGGVISSIHGGPVDLENPRFLASATPILHQEMLEVLRKAEVSPQ